MEIYPDLRNENLLYNKGHRALRSEDTSSPSDSDDAPMLRRKLTKGERLKAAGNRVKDFSHGWYQDLLTLLKSHWNFVRMHYWFTIFTIVFSILTYLTYRETIRHVGCQQVNYIAKERVVLRGGIGFNCKEHSNPMKMMCPAPFNPLIASMYSDDKHKKSCTFKECDTGKTIPVKRWLFYNDVEVKLYKDVILVDQGKQVVWPQGPHRNGSLFGVWVTFCTPSEHLSKIKELRYKRICAEVGCNIPSLVDPDGSGPSTLGKIHDETVKTCGELSCYVCREFTLWLLCLPTVKFLVENLMVVIITFIFGCLAKFFYKKIAKNLKFTKEEKERSMKKDDNNNIPPSPPSDSDEQLSEEVIEMSEMPPQYEPSAPTIPTAPATLGVLASLVTGARAQDFVVSSSCSLDLGIMVFILALLILLLACKRRMFCPIMLILLPFLFTSANAMNTAVLSNTLCTSTDCTSRALIALQPDSTFTILSGRGTRSEKIQVTLSKTYFTPSIKSIYFFHDGHLSKDAPEDYSFCKVEECNNVEYWSEFTMRVCRCEYGVVFNSKIKQVFKFAPDSVYEVGQIVSWQAKYQLKVTVGNYTETTTLIPGQTSQVQNIKIWSGSAMYSPPVNTFLMKEIKELGWTRLVHNAAPQGGPIAGLVGWNQCPSSTLEGCSVDKAAYGCTYYGCKFLLPKVETSTQSLPVKIDKGTLGPGGSFTLDYGQSALFTVESKEPLHSELGGSICQMESSSVGGKSNTQDGVEITVSLTEPNCEFLLTIAGFTHFFVSSTKEHKSYWTLEEGFDRKLDFVSGKFNSSNILLGEVERAFTVNELWSTGYLSSSPISGLVNHLEFGTLSHLLGSGSIMILGGVIVLLLKK